MFDYNIFFTPIDKLPRITKENAISLERLGIINLRDLLFYKPSSYEIKDIRPNLSQLKDGQIIQTEIIINDIQLPNSRRQPIKILGVNDTGSILLVFFNKIPPFIFNRLKIGSKHVISGKVQFFDYYFQISHPEFILNTKLELSQEPIYPLTYGIVNKQLYSYILNGIELIENHFTHYYNNHINNNDSEEIKTYLKSLIENIKILHLYKSSLQHNQIDEAWFKSIKTLAEQELFANQLLLQNIRRHVHTKNGRSFPPSNELKSLVLASLNFQLTRDQALVIQEIEKDQENPLQMMRLLQGDVGSGKTLVALLTMVNVATNGSQASLMAPTDLLANQHYQFYQKALDSTGIKISILTGKTPQSARRIISENLENGKIDILIGTHALFQEKVNFKDLAYIVIDEQQRFGVEQRLNLINKASHPDVLVMTATPIPRSLAITMFGDMAISKLKSKPQNRLPIVTSIVSINKIDKVIEAVSKKINSGEKVYWVCPLIDQKDKDLEITDQDGILSDITTRYNAIEPIFSNKVGIIHGKMKNEQKDSVMQQFRDGVILILIATTVIEVGIDVSDATLIIIEDAQKFGLAQLHQLRGRVGRGSLQSYCIMLYNPKRLSNVARKRFEIMRESNDGFYIAEQDLILRGSGEILGTRQSGEPKFFFANITEDLQILIKANNLAKNHKYSDFSYFQIRLFARNSDDMVKSG